MIKDNEFHVLVGLDCLLDFRLGAISTIDENMRNRILSEKDSPYFKRVIDDFDWLGVGTTAKVKEILASPTPDLVLNSFRTLLVDELINLSIAVVLDSGTGPVFDKLVIHVNTWPLKLEYDEIRTLADVLADVLSSYDDNDNLLVAPDIEIVNISMEDLSFSNIKNRFRSIYLYNWTDWLAARKEEIKSCKHETHCASIELHAPALFTTLPNRDSLKLDDGGHINPFKVTQQTMSLWIGLSFENPQLFSVPDPFHLKDV